MSSIFKEARLKAGLDIRDVARDLKVKHQYLCAIEDEDFSVLPGKAYVSGYSRMYAKYLGINLTESPISKNASERIWARPEKLKKYTGQRIALLLALVGCLILSFWYGFSEVEVDRSSNHSADILVMPLTFHNHNVVLFHKEYDLNKLELK